ncbi:MAG: hypothetical protein L0Y36_09615 [Planctomycetales bacterium]|nr:hypothetical protein [Planctomycetales bacterium]
MINSKERVRMALSFEQPDRTPVFATFVPEVEARLRQETGITLPDLGAAIGNDMVKVCVGLEKSFYGQPEPEYTDEWGIRWRYVKNQFGVFTEIVSHPLAGDMSKLRQYKIPDPDRPTMYEEFRQMKGAYGKDKWLIGSSQISIFEASWYLRGLDQFLMDMAVEPDYAAAVMDKVMQFPLAAAKNFIRLGADMVWFGDDVSMQTGMMISQQMWRQFLKPRYAVLFDECKKQNPTVKIAYHSCGNCGLILDDMIEIGLDVLNPLQPRAIDPVAVKKRYGNRLALFGGLCVQEVMPHGTPQQITAEVKKLITECGRGGGYILAPAHHIQADTPLENIRAFYKAALNKSQIF